MLDGVFNHVGPEFPALVEARRDPDSRDASLFRREADGSLGTFEGHGGLIALDHSSPEVARTVTDVLIHWADRGADAWRLDAAYSVPSEFWATVLPPLRERHPDVYVVGEVLHGDYAAAVRDGGLDSVTQYELWQGVWHALAEVNLFELELGAAAARRVPRRLRAADLRRQPRRHAHRQPDRRRAPPRPRDRAALHARRHAVGLLRRRVRVAGRQGGAGRRRRRRASAFPSTPAEVPGAGVPDALPEVLALHQELIGVRRRHPWLHTARSRTVSVANESLVLEVTGVGAGQALVVALNLGDDELRVADPAPGGWLAGRDAGLDGDVLSVGPHGWAVVVRA